MEKFEKTFDKWYDVNRKLYGEALEYIKEKMDENKVQSVEFDLDDPEENMCVEYDGGSHPEYASNVFSMVLGVVKDDKGDVFINIDDCDKYEVDRVNAWSLGDVALALKHYFERGKKNEEERS